ncbi:MAG: hypothetical protein AM325_010440 [Candidatus Thorarchaeota archaeon SMTZ1-45]|nr:MAG: hypothetical protein AM325_12035 [Candidatus Thorarchaeota archaeon SMTZ1-45]
MSVVNDGSSPISKEITPTYPKKRRFVWGLKNQKEPKTHEPDTKGCFNCNHHLSKYYYWKQSPCDTCIRSPAYYYNLAKPNLNDNWQPTLANWTLRRNMLY